MASPCFAKGETAGRLCFRCKNPLNSAMRGKSAAAALCTLSESDKHKDIKNTAQNPSGVFLYSKQTENAERGYSHDNSRCGNSRGYREKSVSNAHL